MTDKLALDISTYGISNLFSDSTDTNDFDLDAIERSIKESDNLLNSNFSFNAPVKQAPLPLPTFGGWGDATQDFSTFTDEQKKVDQIETMFQSFPVDSKMQDLLQDDADEDELIRLKENIEGLKQTLIEEQISYDNIAYVNDLTSVSKARKVERAMQVRLDNLRLREMIEEVALTLCSGVEEVCNGENEILGGKPDLRGYSNTLKLKLRRMRGKTTYAVSQVLQNSNMPWWLTLLLDIGPSLFLFARDKQNMHRNMLDQNDFDVGAAKRGMLTG